MLFEIDGSFSCDNFDIFNKLFTKCLKIWFSALKFSLNLLWPPWLGTTSQVRKTQTFLRFIRRRKRETSRSTSLTNFLWSLCSSRKKEWVEWLTPLTYTKNPELWKRQSWGVAYLQDGWVTDLLSIRSLEWSSRRWCKFRAQEMAGWPRCFLRLSSELLKWRVTRRK